MTVPISIFIPVWNESKWLIGAIESVRPAGSAARERGVGDENEAERDRRQRVRRHGVGPEDGQQDDEGAEARRGDQTRLEHVLVRAGPARWCHRGEPPTHRTASPDVAAESDCTERTSRRTSSGSRCGPLQGAPLARVPPKLVSCPPE